MAFCSNCGAQLEGDESFCVKCGSDLTAKAGAAAAPAAQAQAVQPIAGVPPQYPPPGAVPIVMAPPPAQSKGHPVMWTLIVVAAVLYGLYYLGTHDQQKQAQTPPAQGQPEAPGQQPAQGQPGTPAQPGGQQPGGAPAQPGDNASLVQMQVFNAYYSPVNGMVQVSNGAWTNRASVSIQSATLECIQYADNGAPITQMQTTLNGPVQPQGTTTFSPFQMGAANAYTKRVNCGIVGVNPAD